MLGFALLAGFALDWIDPQGSRLFYKWRLRTLP